MGLGVPRSVVMLGVWRRVDQTPPQPPEGAHLDSSVVGDGSADCKEMDFC